MVPSTTPAFAGTAAFDARPIAQTDRITAIDALRGFALMLPTTLSRFARMLRNG